MSSTAVSLLFLALSLLQAVRDNPVVPDTFRDHAMQIAYQAIDVAQNELQSVPIVETTQEPVAVVAASPTPVQAEPAPVLSFVQMPTATYRCDDEIRHFDLTFETSLPATAKLYVEGTHWTTFATGTKQTFDYTSGARSQQSFTILVQSPYGDMSKGGIFVKNGAAVPCK